MKKSVKNFLLLLLLAVITVCTYSVITQWSRDFTPEGLRSLLYGADPVYMVLAGLCAFGFIWFEGAALRCTCRFLGHGFGFGRAIVFSASDIYFSAITPSAAGGQPAALLMMMRRGVPAAVATMALLLNLVMYTAAILAVSILAFLFFPQLLLGLEPASQIFVYIGAALQVGFIVLFIVCIFREKTVMRIASFGLKLCCRVKLIRDYDMHMEKLRKTVGQYNRCGALLRSEKLLLVKVFLLNLAQRLSVIMVAVFTFLAVGGAPGLVPEAFAAQTFAVLGSNAMPVPGAVGIVDYIFMNGFARIIDDPVSLGLLSRGLSFYATSAFCGLLMLADFIKRKIRNRDDGNVSKT